MTQEESLIIAQFIQREKHFKEALINSSFEKVADIAFIHMLKVEDRYKSDEIDLSDKEMLIHEARMKQNICHYEYIELLKKELEISNALIILMKEKGKCVIKGIKNKAHISEEDIIPFLEKRFKERQILTEYEIKNNSSLGKEPTIENITTTKKHIEDTKIKHTHRGAKEKNYKLKDAIKGFLWFKAENLTNHDYKVIYNALDIMKFIDSTIKEQWAKTDSYHPEIAFIKSIIKEILKKRNNDLLEY